MLREVSLTELEAQSSQLSPLLYRRARHVITENQRVQQAAEAMSRDYKKLLSRLIQDSHTSLRDNFEVSNSSLDAMVECAFTAPGCLGARMTGAGFGGCAVAVVKAEQEREFINIVQDCYRKKTGLDPEIIFYIPSSGATRIAPIVN